MAGGEGQTLLEFLNTAVVDLPEQPNGELSGGPKKYLQDSIY